MPMIDMPLEELKQYQGSSPCPTDIDQYWDRALDEMKNTDAQVTLTSAAFQTTEAECFDLKFTGVDGSRIYAKYLRPKNIQKPVPCVLMFHGYTMDSGDWWEKLAYINAGIAVAALDCRGQGGRSEDIGSVKGTTLKGHIIRGLDEENPDKLLFRQVLLDTAQLAGIVMGFDEIDASKVGAIGGSQGGALTVACAALEPCIALIAPMYPFLSDYKRVWDMDMDKGAYEELRTYFRHFDPRHEREDEIFRRLGYIDIQNIAKRVRAKVLWATGLMDEICPPSTQFAVYNKISSQKEMKIYPDFGHEHLPGFNDMTYSFMQQLL